jgi:hypothetical protein
VEGRDDVLVSDLAVTEINSALARRLRQGSLAREAARRLQHAILGRLDDGVYHLAFESERMAIAKAKFIGLSSADPDRYGLPRNVGIKLNEKDISRGKELLKYRWFQRKPWQEEIKRMLD